ncbi:MAG: efflux RND transporter periplasmic adaptor subunit [Myxococcaceae bacterium]
MQWVSTSLKFSLLIILSTQLLAQSKEIEFPKNYPGLSNFKLLTLKVAPSMLRVEAPAQVVASIQNQSILFSQSEISSLYSQYLQSSANFERTEKNKIRVEDMFKNQAATARELNDVRSEFSNAKATKTEFEVRLKSAGFPPADLKQAKPKTVWLLAEMPENQLHEVQKDEEVVSTFNSFAGQTFLGKAAAIGDTVDPATRTVKIRVVLDNTKGLLLPGMYARCDFGQPQQAAISIPLSAMVTVEQKNYVFVAKSKTKFERREITLLNSNNQDAIVSTGLKPDEQIVTSGVILLKGISFGY